MLTFLLALASTTSLKLTSELCVLFGLLCDSFAFLIHSFRSHFGAVRTRNLASSVNTKKSSTMADTTPRCNEAADAFQAIVEEISSDTSSLNFDELCNMVSAKTKEAGSKLMASPVEEEPIKFKPGCEAQGLEPQRCIDGGDVDPRSAAGQRFAAWLSKNPEDEAKSKSFKGVHGATALKKAVSLEVGRD